jgi:GDP-mannose 6-dehydrogenase
MKISIFGAGYVGVVSGACLAHLGHDVIAVDVSPDKVRMINRGQSPIVEQGVDTLISTAVAEGKIRATESVEDAIASTDVSFISVGTPSASDGSVSMDAVRNVLAQIGRALRDKAGSHAVVMRSTVPPGTAERVAIPILESESGRRLGERLFYYSNPEFLREGTAVRDFHAPPYTLVGAAPGDDAAVVKEIYAGLTAPVHVAAYPVSESVKYLSNVYHAVKLAFANEAGAVLAAHGVNAPEAFRLFCEDRILNISPAYLRPGFAFGGSCLPKDIRSFLSLADSKGITAPFLKQVLPSNQTIIDRVYDKIAHYGRQPVALIGLAFKPGTDDLRESPFVTLAERLIGKGYGLKVFDRSVQVARLVGSNKSYIDREIPHIERLMVNNVDDALQGCRLAVVGHLDKSDQPLFEKSLNKHTVLDLTGAKYLQARNDIVYQGICW